MAKILGTVFGIVMVCACTNAHAQRSAYGWTAVTQSEAGGLTEKGVLVIDKKARTPQGYTTYLGTKTTIFRGKRTRVYFASVIRINTSRGTHLFAAYHKKRPFWMYVFRKTRRGITLTSLDAWGNYEEARRVVGSRLVGRLVVSGRNRHGAWGANVSISRDNRVVWQAGRIRLTGMGCRIGNTYVMAISQDKQVALFCYTPKGRDLKGTQALLPSVPARVTETLAPINQNKRRTGQFGRVAPLRPLKAMFGLQGGMTVAEVAKALRRNRMLPLGRIRSHTTSFKFRPKRFWGFRPRKGHATFSGGRLKSVKFMSKTLRGGATTATYCAKLVKECTRRLKLRPREVSAGSNTFWIYQSGQTKVIVSMIETSSNDQMFEVWVEVGPPSLRIYGKNPWN